MGILSLIPSVINGISSIWGQQTGAQQTRDVNAANMKLAEYQYNKELEMWNRQNEYNSPKAQMSRFSEAGLNPNLIYGQGTAGNATQIPRYQAPQMQRAPQVDYLGMITSVLGTYLDFKQRDAQIDLQREQRNKVIQETAKVRELYPIQQSILRQEVQRGGIRTNILRNTQDMGQNELDYQKQYLFEGLRNLRMRTANLIQENKINADRWAINKELLNLDKEIKAWVNRYKTLNLLGGIVGKVL